MLIDKKTLQKLEHLEREYGTLRFESIGEIPMEFWETREHFRSEPGRKEKAQWKKSPSGTKWGGNGWSAWFRGNTKLPPSAQGKKVFLRADTGGTETMLFIHSNPQGVFDSNHPVVMAVSRGKSGQCLHVALESYAGHVHPGTQPYDQTGALSRKSLVFQCVEMMIEREDVSSFVFDLAVLRRLMHALEDHSLRKHEIMKGLVEVYALVPAVPAEMDEELWRPALLKAIRVMRPLLQQKNGPTASRAGLIGHSHLDTAWLWPLSETWRKAGRTFSSMVNLMEQYKELTFIQSAPCHAEVVRDEWPALFKRMQRLAADGRWEPNGGMWVEPDCNIPSGESLVRQLLVGQRATREMFGYTSNTLWMPDVFGYSAALPQILQSAGIRFFCTTKMAWNDTTRFPYDTFIWRGIDGSKVITHFNAIHCWPDPETLIGQWNWIQHKETQDSRLCSYGFGDGGGGPMAEMVEISRRIHDLEGCPRAEHTTVGAFMEEIEKRSGNLPEWVGELYLEGHRGTLTSISEIKKGNRKAEIALRQAEFMWSLAALEGAVVPRETFLCLWKTLLTNQFHDILPGSSILEVNEEAVETFDQIIRAAQDLGHRALEGLTSRGPRNPHRLLLINTLSWDRDGIIRLSQAPEGTVPDHCAMHSQWITTPEGKTSLIIRGMSVPSLGGIVLQLKKGETTSHSPFQVNRNRIDTPHLKIKLGKEGQILSLIHKETERELVRQGGSFNRFLLGDDVPGSWDNWDIDSDQALKMRPVTRLTEREVSGQGALQLRLRQTWTLGGRSKIIQDMVCHSHSSQIDFETMIHWGERRKLLKAVFQMDLLADFARHEIQYGHAERPTHRNLPQDRARFEVCAHKWTDLSENGFGIALLNDCKYGVSVLGSEIALSLIKSGIHPDPRGDEGTHVMTYSILPHKGPFSVSGVLRPAYELNVPLTEMAVSSKIHSIPSLFMLDRENVIVEAVKWAEDKDALVIRLYEASKTGGYVRLSFRPDLQVKSIQEVNLLEENPSPLQGNKGQVRFYMRPFEIKTLQILL